jgi:hypothetical protein
MSVSTILLGIVNLYLQGLKDRAMSEMQAYIALEEPNSDVPRQGGGRAIAAAMLAGEYPWPMAKKILEL